MEDKIIFDFLNWLIKSHYLLLEGENPVETEADILNVISDYKEDN